MVNISQSINQTKSSSSNSIATTSTAVIVNGITVKWYVYVIPRSEFLFIL